MTANKSNIVRREEKGAPLTYAEMDANFSELINVIDDAIADKQAQDLVNDGLHNDNDTQNLAITALEDAMPDKVNISDIINTLTDVSTNKPLSAAMGKFLYDQLLASIATIRRYTYDVAQGQATIVGADTSGQTLTYVPGTVMLVEMGGALLYIGKDYSAANGTSLTLVDPAEVATQLSITVFGSFTVADHYTKGENDALLTQKVNTSAVIDVAHGGTGKTTEFRKGFIDGLRLVYTDRTTFTVAAGSAYVNGSILEVTGNILVTPTLAASAFHHVYLYSNGGAAAIEVSSAVPVSYYGTAYQKTGDATRRYLGSLLTGPASTLWKFRHNPALSEMLYNEGVPGTAPFVMFSVFNAATPLLLSTQPAAIAPIETALQLHVTVSTAGLLNTAPADQFAAPSGSNWEKSFSSRGNGAISLSREPATLGKFYIMADGTNQVACYCSGYTFER